MGLKGFASVLTLAAALLAACSSAKDSDSNENIANLPVREIRDLSSAIKAAHSYREDVRREIDTLEVNLNDATGDAERCEVSLALAKRFRPINTDSSLYYANRAKAIAADLDVQLRERSQIAVIDALATAGLFTEATELFNRINPHRLPMRVRLDYWLAGRRLYGYMKSYSQGNQDCYSKYDRLYQAYDDSLLHNLPGDSDLRAFIYCERLVTERDLYHAREHLEELLKRIPETNNLYGMAAYQLAIVWQNLGDDSRYASMLAVSALSDVKNCITEGLALPTLAYWLYEKGELGDSFAFINFALEEATAANVRMRAVTIARFVPMIEQAYRDKLNSSRDELMVYFIIITLLFIATVMLIVFLVKQNKRSRANAAKLVHTSRRQESYIGNFIGLYSSYADRLNHLTKLVSTKLATGQTAELKKLVDSGKFDNQDDDDIHKIFDAAFLDIYPDFVARINSLLKPEEAITVKTEGHLTPELRIYAFVKLGIEESTRIAQILHYSIHTVYAYRNKMRNKALARDTFDSDVKNL